MKIYFRNKILIAAINGLICFFVFITGTLAQTPGIAISRQIGGTGYDMYSHVTSLNNGDLIFSGFTESVDGIGTGNHGMKDFLIQCMSPAGQIKWTKVVGGSKEEGGNYNGNGSYAAATADGGFYFVGSAMSTDGDIPLMRGFGDVYLAKFNANGTIQWSKTYGGNNTEWVSGIQTTADGGCIISATTYSNNNGDVPANHSGPSIADVWIVKLDKDGNIQWNKIYGGTGEETAHDIQLTKDGGYVFTADVTSEDGDLIGSVTPAGSLRRHDIWIVKIDAAGAMLWSKRFGGSDDDDNAKIICTSTNEFVVGLSSRSLDIDFAANSGLYDIWILKLSATGDLLWKKQMGGGGWDTHSGIAESEDGNYIATGFSYSSSLTGQPVNNKGECDVVLYKLDKTTGNVKWFTGIGGTGRDFSRGILQLPGNELVLAGETASGTGDFPMPIGNYDAFIIKIAAFNIVKGIVFYDYNNNNIKDANEPFVNNVNVITSKANGVSTSTFTRDGTFYNEVDSGTVYTKVNLLKSGYITSTPDSFQSVFPAYYQTVVKNFALHPVPGKRDVRTDIYTTSAARPGREAVYVVKCYNTGTDTVASGTVRFSKDPRVNLVSVTPAYNMLVGDTLIWNYSNLKPLDTLSFTIKIGIQPFTVVMGEWLKYYAEILPFANDLEQGDNRFRLYHLVTGPYDPNDKMESHGPFYSKTEYDKNEYLNYTIRFQNVGNDTAFKVLIKDTLDTKLDWNSIEMIAASHSYKLHVDNGRYCEWIFDNIQLPDSNVNELKSHGFVSYRIKLKRNLLAGDTIFNKASIYFDYNLPVVTNSADVIIANNVLTAVREVQNNEMKLQLGPNPAAGYSNLFISGKLKGKFVLRLIDGNGKVVYEQVVTRNSALENNTISLQLQRLSAGIYFLQLQQKEKSWWQKIIVQ